MTIFHKVIAIFQLSNAICHKLAPFRDKADPIFHKVKTISLIFIRKRSLPIRGHPWPSVFIRVHPWLPCNNLQRRHRKKSWRAGMIDD